MVLIPPPPRTRDTAARRRARERLASVIWNPDGSRRLPPEDALVAALTACREDDVWWVCEASSAGPVYLLPTREWLTALVRALKRLKPRTVVEVAAGDGFLASILTPRLKGARVIATDDASWSRPAGRMSARDRREFRGVAFAGLRPGVAVQRLSATAAVRKFRPDVVLVAWAPPGLMVERAIRGPCRYVLDVGVDGFVCGNGPRTWRFRKEFLAGAIEQRALCRLDARPRERRATRVTLYYGARHPEHGLEGGLYV